MYTHTHANTQCTYVSSSFVLLLKLERADPLLPSEVTLLQVYYIYIYACTQSRYVYIYTYANIEYIFVSSSSSSRSIRNAPTDTRHRRSLCYRFVVHMYSYIHSLNICIYICKNIIYIHVVVARSLAQSRTRRQALGLGGHFATGLLSTCIRIYTVYISVYTYEHIEYTFVSLSSFSRSIRNAPTDSWPPKSLCYRSVVHM